MAKRYRSTFVGLAAVALMAWGGSMSPAAASTRWASPARELVNDVPERVPTAVVLIALLLPGSAGLFFLLRAERKLRPPRSDPRDAPRIGTHPTTAR